MEIKTKEDLIKIITEQSSKISELETHIKKLSSSDNENENENNQTNNDEEQKNEEQMTNEELDEIDKLLNDE